MPSNTIANHGKLNRSCEKRMEAIPFTVKNKVRESLHVKLENKVCTLISANVQNLMIPKLAKTFTVSTTEMQFQVVTFTQ